MEWAKMKIRGKTKNETKRGGKGEKIEKIEGKAEKRENREERGKTVK